MYTFNSMSYISPLVVTCVREGASNKRQDIWRACEDDLGTPKAGSDTGLFRRNQPSHTFTLRQNIRKGPEGQRKGMANRQGTRFRLAGIKTGDSSPFRPNICEWVSVYGVLIFCDHRCHTSTSSAAYEIANLHGTIVQDSKGTKS